MSICRLPEGQPPGYHSDDLGSHGSGLRNVWIISANDKCIVALPLYDQKGALISQETIKMFTFWFILMDLRSIFVQRDLGNMLKAKFAETEL